MLTRPKGKVSTTVWNTPLTQALHYIGHELVAMSTDTEGKPSRVNFVDCVIEDCTGQKGFASEVLASTKGGNRAIYAALRGPNSERLQRFFAKNLRNTRIELVRLLQSGAVIQADMKRDPNPTDAMITTRTMVSRMRNEYEHAVTRIREICHTPAEEVDIGLSTGEFPELAKLTGINSTGDIGVSQFSSEMFDEFTGLPGIDLDTFGRDQLYVANSLDALRNGQLPLPSGESIGQEEMTRRISAYETFIGRELNDQEIADIISGIGATTAGLGFKKFIEAMMAAPMDTDPNPVSSFDASGPAMDGLPDGDSESASSEPDPRVPDSFLDMNDRDVQLMVKIRNALSELDEQRQKYKNIVEYSELMTLHDTVIYFTASTDPKFLITAHIQLRATGQIPKLNVGALKSSTGAFKRKLAMALEVPQDMIDTQVELIESDTPFSQFIDDTYHAYGIDMQRLVQVQTCAAMYTLYMYKKHNESYRVGYQLTRPNGKYSADYTVYPKEETTDYAKMSQYVGDLKNNKKVSLVIDLYLRSDMDQENPWFHSFECVSVPDYLTTMDDPEMSAPRNELGTEIFEKLKQYLVSGIALIIKEKVPGVDIKSSVESHPVDEYLCYDLLFKIPGPITESQNTDMVKAIDLTTYSDMSMTMMMAPISSSIKIGTVIEVDE